MIKEIDLINASKNLFIYGKLDFEMNNIQLVKLFIEEKKQSSINTAKSYETDIKNFFKVEFVEYITLEMLRLIKPEDVMEFINNLTLLGRSSSTINRNISSLSSLYKWLILHEKKTYGENFVFNNNPFLNVNINKPPINHKETKFMNKYELVNFLSTLKENTLLELRNKTIVYVAVRAGLGRGQLINLKIKDIVQIHDKSFIILDKIGYTTRLIELDIQTKELLFKYINKSKRDFINDRDDYVFKSHGRNPIQEKEKLNPQTINKMFKKLCIDANLEINYKVISLKHSCFMLTLSREVNFDNIKRISTGRSEKTVGKYINQYGKHYKFLVKNQ